MNQAYTTLQDQAYIHMKNMILNDQLREGEIYSETKMAAELQISRTPFKAALVRLSQDKYIDIIPSKGFRVHTLSRQDIRSTYQTRTAIEIFCAISIQEARDTPEGMETLGILRASLEEMRSVLNETDPEPFRAQDRRFHTTLLAFCDNETFNELYEFSIYHQIVTTSKGHVMTPDEKEVTCKEHARIIAAIGSGSVEECCRAVTRHMRTSEEGSLKSVKD